MRKYWYQDFMSLAGSMNDGGFPWGETAQAVLPSPCPQASARWATAVATPTANVSAPSACRASSACLRLRQSYPTAPRMYAQRLTMTAQLENASLTHLTEQSVLAMLSVRAPPAPEEDSKRPAMDLVACIDRSGSMRGPKMRLMKQTLELLVKRAGLKHSDRFSIVTFDSSVKVDVPLEYMDSQGRSRRRTSSRVSERVQQPTYRAVHSGQLTSLCIRDKHLLMQAQRLAPPASGTH